MEPMLDGVEVDHRAGNVDLASQGVTENSQSERKGPERSLMAVNRDSVFMPAMSVDVALARRAAIVEFTRRIMVRDQDFGEIPGTSKPALLKPGAEKLCSFFGLEPEFTPVAEDIDWTGAEHGGEAFCYARYRCRLLRCGRLLGMGEGSCNSWESRYRFRWVCAEQIPEHMDRSRLPKRGGQRTLCEFAFAIERAETTGNYAKPAEYWGQFKAAIASGAARRVERDTRIGKSLAFEIDVDTTLYRIANPDVADLVNTIQKMAQKRALVAATLIATSASEFFTQDVEDAVPEMDGSTAMVSAPPISATTRLQVGRKLAGSSTGAVVKPWKNFGQMRKYFEQIREVVGETRYLEQLHQAGVSNPSQFRSASKAMECYSKLVQASAEQEVA